MSVEVISHVMRLDIPDGVAKLVAFVLADYANAETGHAWPKLETLARKCSQSVRTVQRKIRLLQKMEVLKVHRQDSATGRQRENLYVFRLPWVSESDDGAAGSGPDQAASRTSEKRGDRGSPQGDAQSPVEPGSVTPMGDTPVTPEGDTAVTPRGIPQKESVKGESPKREIPSVAPAPHARIRERAPEGALPPPAALCPNDFEPDGSHYAAAEALGFDAAFVRQTARSMHAWSHANAHRSIAWKADWPLAFDGILDRALREAAEKASRKGPKRYANGAIGLLLERMNGHGQAVPEDVRATRNDEARRMAESGQWPRGGSVFVERDSAEGRAWEEHFARFGTQATWLSLDKGVGWNMPARWPPPATCGTEIGMELPG
ncbi:helix-turn-helix domain-containing protein [Methylobacterium sp. J-030]|uniref:helix-turn-helix domain-containing protein n=1 Tax=Methylobacterium sp. J-030 TaxID=2836627 RepID=UPI001FBA2410|nr:helix-turn-helix domain-containing protein [Methylobacterium sp. J-030]MCJ2068301.1 helix-turn-helix domain-containing protein [Methylobacterium sp. J-030]